MEQVTLHTRLEPGRFSRSLGAGGWSTPVRGTCKHWVSQASVLDGAYGGYSLSKPDLDRLETNCLSPASRKLLTLPCRCHRAARLVFSSWTALAMFQCEKG